MIRIPFTSISVSWHVPVTLLVFMAVSSSWQRGLLAFVVVFGGMALIGIGFWRPFTWLLYSKKQRPGEDLRDLSQRMRLEIAKDTASREEDCRQNGGRRDCLYAKYHYVALDCGHVIFEYFPDEVPRKGNKIWCWGHRRHGPAQEQTVLETFRWPGSDFDRKMILI